MSHSMGQVEFKDGTIMYYEYNGTTDNVISHLYNTKQEVRDNWRNHEWNECKCGNDEDVDISTTYGGGIYWEGKACKKCMAFTDGYKPYDSYDTNEKGWWF